jgi:hypothetical protein
MGEKIVDVLQDELEMNHEYCRAIQVLRHDIRQVYEIRGGADHERERQLEQAELEARR